MDLSIIIRVKDDIKIKRCIESIDEVVEKLVVLNTPTNEIRNLTTQLDVRTMEIDNNNLAKAYNVGIEASSYDNVLLMDSDCVFHPGTIKKLYDGLKEDPLSKGKVIFTYKSAIGKIIALSREYHVTDIVNAYAPPLAFNRNIKEKIGGYFFDEDLFWTEDHEFDQRIKKANLSIKYNPNATIEHKELTIKSDLKSSFYYGAGYFEGIKKEVTQSSFLYGGDKNLIKSLIYDCLRTATLPILFIDVTYKKGILPAMFMCTWMGAFSAGYYLQCFFNILGKDKK